MESVDKRVLLAKSLLRQPTAFKVVAGLVLGLQVPEISEEFNVNYKYAYRVVSKLASEGLVVKEKVLGRVIAHPTQDLVHAYNLARELAKTSGGFKRLGVVGAGARS